MFGEWAYEIFGFCLVKFIDSVLYVKGSHIVFESSCTTLATLMAQVQYQININTECHRFKFCMMRKVHIRPIECFALV